MRSIFGWPGIRIFVVLLTLVSAIALAACGQKPDAMLKSAQEFLDRNDVKSAVIQAKNALQVDPNLPQARLILGKALLMTGDASGAETELRKALALQAPKDAVIPQLAGALLAQGQAKKLIEEMGAVALTSGTAKADLLTSLAIAYGTTGQGEKSEAALNAAVQADGNFEPALLLKVRQKALTDVTGALADVDAIIAKSPKNAQALKLKGDLLLYLKNQPDAALVAYRKSVEVQPDFMPGHVAAVRVLFQQNQLDAVEKQLDALKALAPNHPQTKYLQAQLAFQHKDFKSARTLLQQALKSVPSNPIVLQLAGATELELNSTLQAESYLAKALQFAPELPMARRLLAIIYARTGNTAKALAVLAPGLARDPVDPALLSVAGELYLQTGDAKKAEQLFSKASQQDPQDVRKRTALDMAQLASGRADALTDLEHIAGSDKGTVADMALISVHLNRQEYDKALKDIDALEKKQPDQASTALLQGRVFVAKKDLASARRSYERALRLEPTSFVAVAGLAGLDVVEKKPEDAKKRFEALLSNDPKNAQAVLALAELAVRTGASNDAVGALLKRAVAADPSQSAARLVLIDFYLRKKDLKQAISAAQDAQSALPDSPEVLDALGRAQQASADFNQAIATFNKLAALQPLSPQPYLRLAEVYMATKDRDAAAQSLHKALEIKPDLRQAEFGFVRLDMDAKNYEGALATARTMQTQAPNDIVGYGLEGDIYANLKQWDAATVAYNTGLRHAPTTELAIKLHKALLASGKTAQADTFSATWQKDHPQDVTYLLYLADGAIGHSDFALAERTYLAVLKQQATNALAFNNLAWVTSKLHKEGAIAYAEKAVALSPNTPAFMDTLAGLLAEKGDYARALELQKRVVDLSQSAPLYRLNLAKIQLKVGAKSDARATLDALAALGNAFPNQSEVAGLRQGL